MPVYTCTTVQSTLRADAKANLAAEFTRIAQQQHIDAAPALPQQPRGHEAVPAVVALAAHDVDPTGRRERTDQVGQAGARPLHQLDARDPPLADRPLVERPLLAGVGERVEPVREGHALRI